MASIVSSPTSVRRYGPGVARAKGFGTLCDSGVGMHAVVVGAGPGGASAALALARAGARVDLIEKNTWPREKTCGDGVSPLAIRELARLGVTVAPNLELRRALVHTPAGTAFRGGWPAATPWGTIIERRAFDEALVGAAIAAGATFHPSTTVRALASDANGVGATLSANGTVREVRADVAVVADGANGGFAKKLGFPEHRSRVVAVRAYATSLRPLVAEYGLFYDRSLSPGYGWIFPIETYRANVGVCVDERVLARGGGDLRVVLHRWLRENAIARELFGDDIVLEAERGGIIPSGRARRARDRIFLVGDAAGVADPFTAEGIYEAITSGRRAADAIMDPSGLATAPARYERTLRELDRNERAARLLRATFNVAIEPYAKFAGSHAPFADRLMTDVFFAKPHWAKMMWNLHFGR